MEPGFKRPGAGTWKNQKRLDRVIYLQLNIQNFFHFQAMEIAQFGKYNTKAEYLLFSLNLIEITYIF